MTFFVLLDKKNLAQKAHFLTLESISMKSKLILGSQTLFAWHWIFLPCIGSFCHLSDLFATIFGAKSGKKIQPPCNWRFESRLETLTYTAYSVHNTSFRNLGQCKFLCVLVRRSLITNENNLPSKDNFSQKLAS